MLNKILCVAFFAALLSAMPAGSRESGLGYDPEADPFEQYREAIATANRTDKLVLVIAGGDWCGWCHALNKLVARNDDVRRSLDETFVVVKVYVGDENYNELFFSQLPEARGAPHFWIIGPDRNVLGSQSTGGFEKRAGGYDKREFLTFIEHWKRYAGRAQAGP